MRAANGLLLLSITALVGCGPTSQGGVLQGTDPSLLKRGIAGVVRLSPAAPIARPGEENSRPLAAARISITGKSGEEIGIAVADTAGRFGVELSEGTYRLMPLRYGDREYPAPPAPQSVEVVNGRVTPVTFLYDSGIR